MPTNYLSCAETAKLVRQALKGHVSPWRTYDDNIGKCGENSPEIFCNWALR